MDTPIRLKLSRQLLATLSLGLLIVSATALADTFTDTLLDIQHRWATTNYQMEGRDQKDAFDALLDDARAFADAYPQRPEALIWQGIVASTYAGVKGPFGAMSLAKEARKALMEAEALDADALDGSVYTSLGTLYFKVPGGLIGFGDKDLARDYLKKALARNPDGIDPNYFYGEFLYEEGEYEAAREALLRARQAPRRQDRAIADEGRLREVDELLREVNARLERRS